ncbi:MAG: GHKL domain-containing protein [Ruminococcaceae bacterium]|nr:GHKL domain-containing protein [Oscillospiraceae bacterium]
MQLFYFFIYIFEAIVAYLYFSDNYKERIKKAYLFPILFVLYLIAFLVNIYANNTSYVNEITMLVVNFLFSKICFNISTKSSIFHSSFLLAVLFSAELITSAMMSYLLHIPLDAYRESFSAFVILVVISKTVYFFVCKLISHFFSYKKLSEADFKRTSVLFIYPLMTIAMLTTLLYASVKYNFSRELNMACVVLSFLSIVFCCFIFIYNQWVQKQQLELMTLQTLKEKDELNRTFYQLLEQKNEEQRVLTHDIKHHLFAISAMNDTTEIKNYISGINPDLEKYQYIGRTNNKMLDLILNKYSMLAKNEGIEFKADIRTSNLLFIDDNDLVSLLGNLLDNAFEAARTSTQKKVLMITNNEKSFVLLSVINSCSSVPVIDNDKLVSTKTDKRFHGYGTKSIEKTAEKYNGVCQWNFNENEMEFHYNILFNK